MLYQSQSYGQILYFVCLDRQAAAVIKKLKVLPILSEFQPTKKIIPVEPTAEIEVVGVGEIEEKCVFIEISKTNFYVSLF